MVEHRHREQASLSAPPWAVDDESEGGRPGRVRYIDPSVTHRLVTRFAASIAPSDTPAARAPGLDRLTAREQEVLLLVAAGYSNTEIGARL